MRNGKCVERCALLILCPGLSDKIKYASSCTDMDYEYLVFFAFSLQLNTFNNMWTSACKLKSQVPNLLNS